MMSLLGNGTHMEKEGRMVFLIRSATGTRFRSVCSLRLKYEYVKNEMTLLEPGQLLKLKI